MISKMNKRRKWKNVGNKEGNNYRRLEFQGTGCYDLMYMQTKELGRK